MAERNDHHSLVALAWEELLHFVAIVGTYPAGTQSAFCGSQAKMFGSYRPINVNQRLVVVLSHPVVIDVLHTDA